MYDDSYSPQTWLQENLRLIVSIFIVAALALGIYALGNKEDVKKKDCSYYSDYSVKDLPARCVDYFNAR